MRVVPRPPSRRIIGGCGAVMMCRMMVRVGDVFA